MSFALQAWGPAALATIGALAALGVDAWGRPRMSALVAAAFVAAGGLLALASAAAGAQRGSAMLAVGGWASVGPAACLLLSAVAVAAMTGERPGPGGSAVGRLAVLGALAAASCAVVAASQDLVVLLLAVETLSLAGFGLVAVSDTDGSREAAMKWFVQSSVAATFLIIGIGVLFSVGSGSTLYRSLVGGALATGSEPARLAGLALVLSALAFKAGAFPFHSWAPDAYETAPAPAAALLASAGKIAGLVAIGTVVAAQAAGGTAPTRGSWVAASIAAGSIVFGNLAALRQRRLSRMLAYSGIAQVGYALVGATTAARSTTALTLFAVAYGIAACGAFLVIAALHGSQPEWDGSIAGLAGLSRRSPALSAALAVFMLSLTGIPLTAGFWGKFAVFGAAVPQWTWLAVLGVIGSVVSFGYYGSVLRSAYLDESLPDGPAEESPAPVEPSRAGLASAAAVSLAVLVALGGVVPFVAGLSPVLGAALGPR